MSRGQTDYWSSVITTPPIYGGGYSSLLVAESIDVDGNSYADLIDQSVPAGYEWHVLSVGI